MGSLIYPLAAALLGLLQRLPLPIVVRLGRRCGALAYWIDARHRKVALENLQHAFGAEHSPATLRAWAREHFRRLGENYCCGIKTAAMSPEALQPHLEFRGQESLLPPPGQPAQSRIVALGHFGNFELYARFAQYVPFYQCATTYRALRQPQLNRLFQAVRSRSGCLFFERRTEARALRSLLGQPRAVLLGLLADQHAGDNGLRLPFLSRDCSTTAAPAVLALRYRCPLHTAVCYRTGPGRWCIEISPPLVTRHEGRRRAPAELMREVNRSFEAAVRRDPLNWFWVHRRWKPPAR